MTDTAPPAPQINFPEVPLADRGHGYRVGTELFLVRHGESMRNIYSNLVCYDPNLTALGWAQALRLGEWMAEHAPVDVVVTSPLRRAHSTALAVANPQGLTPVVITGLEEFSQEFFHEIPVHHPTMPWLGRDCWTPEFAQAPNFVAFRDRVLAALSEVLEIYSGQRICIVSHGGTMNVLIAALAGSSHLSVWNENTGVSYFVWPEWKRWLMRYVNRTDHLRDLNPDDYPRVPESDRTDNGQWRLRDDLFRDWAEARPHSQLSYLANGLRRSDRILFVRPPDAITPVRVALRSRQAVVLSEDLFELEAGELRRAMLNANHIRFQYPFHPLPYPDGHFDYVAIPETEALNDELQRVLAPHGKLVFFAQDGRHG
ncbi:MAG: histidine phosphatase family protein [Caldilineales bacterium]|nr:histidine phosphatase family protein [Caldilineales bacterium]